MPAIRLSWLRSRRRVQERIDIVLGDVVVERDDLLAEDVPADDLAGSTVVLAVKHCRTPLTVLAVGFIVEAVESLADGALDALGGSVSAMLEYVVYEFDVSVVGANLAGEEVLHEALFEGLETYSVLSFSFDFVIEL